MVRWLNIPFCITRPDVDEQRQTVNFPQPEPPPALATRLALLKARSIHSKGVGEWILAADTVVELDGQALGKPQDAADARRMLGRLRGRAHYVHTGLTLRKESDLPRSAATDGATKSEIVSRVTTRVWMRNYTAEEIETYISDGDPLDKAGAYAIQHADFHPVARLAHCYANVVGLPLCSVSNLLRSQGVVVAVDVPALCLAHFGYRCHKIDRGIML
jgi:MAF protein